MKWNDVPDGVSFAMTKDTAMSMRAGRTKPFMYGMVCGAVCLLALQSCGGDSDTADKDKPSPGPSITATHKPN